MFLTLPVIVIAALLLFVVLRRPGLRGRASLLAFSITLILWAGAYAYFLNSKPSDALIWLSLIYLAATVASTSLLIYTLSYTNHSAWLSRWGLALLALEPLLTQILIWVPRWRNLFFTPRPGALGVVLTTGPWYWINQTYSDGLLVLSLILLAQTFLNKSKQYLLQSSTIAFGLCLPVLIKILGLTGFRPFPNMDLAPFSYALTAVLLIYSLLRFKLLDIAMIPRDVVVESMSDGWMVTDNNNRILDLNPAAETLLGVPREELFGQPADQIMSNWPKLNVEPSAREVEIRGSLKIHGEWRFLNVRILPLLGRAGKQVGNVVLWRDITERKRSDDARQSARDEMFMLLHQISGAASQTLNINDFLAEAMYQIAYAFQSQVSLIFLRETGAADAGEPKYSLAAHHGMPLENISHLASSPQVTRIVAEVLKNKEPFFVPDVITEPRLPASMQQSGNKTLLLVPLLTAQQGLGVLGITRLEGPPYGIDEVTRLTVVAEELASLIYSDRQRQIAIALEERQRLVRDLHDSTTQKLYGLVQLTEAAQASLEAGTVAQSAQVLSRIGENARQALKEMRLFLFEMKPVDIERDGLVSVLHQRLASVEGRADIKTRLLADDKINLPLEKEVALYFIAQEALNNILKHANATSVMIRLKNRKNSCALEIEDDGCGFDPHDFDKGGMGMHNMNERLAKVSGKLVVKSFPGKGTRITATVSKNKIPTRAKKEKQP
jgi:PAS domain S-box-containing protein